MARIEWQQSFATGIESIDEQHKKIIEFISCLEVSMEKQNRDEVSDILKGLREYIHSHFAYEEQLLEQSGYKFSESHIRGHRRFVERLDSFRHRFNSGACIGRELHGFLCRWVVNHIANEDQQYVATVMTALDSESSAQLERQRALCHNFFQ